MKYYCTYIICFFTLFDSQAQGSFLNKKNCIDFNVSLSTPVLSGYYKAIEYKEVNSKMEERQSKLYYGFDFSYLRFIKKAGIGFFIASKNLSVPMPDRYYSNYFYSKNVEQNDSTGIRVESLKFMTYYFAPRFEFKTKEGYQGVGLAYDLSVGFSLTYFRNKSYSYSINEFSANSSEENWTAVDNFNTQFDWKPIAGVFLQTGVKMRIQIANNLAFNTGFRYMISQSFKPKTLKNVYPNADIFSYEDVFYQVQRKNLFGISLNLGLAYSF